MSHPDTFSPSRHPFQLFTLILCVVTGAPILLGKTPAPGSMEESLPPWLIFGWALMLVTGSMIALAGTVWRDPFVGMNLELVGLIAAGTATLVYGVVLTGKNWGTGNMLPASIVLGFGFSCIWRCGQLYRRIQSVVHLAEYNQEQL